VSSDLDRFGIYFCEILTLYRTVVTLYWLSVVLWDCSLGVDNAEKYDMEFSRSCPIGHGSLHFSAVSDTEV